MGKYIIFIGRINVKTFEIIENSNAVIIEFSESGIGLGIEAGFAVAKNIPVYVLLPKGRVLSPTMRGVCKKYFEYETDADIQCMFRAIESI